MKNGAPVLDNATVRTITILGRAGQTLRSIERATGIRREHVSKILKRQGIRVRPPRFRRFPGLATMATAVTATGHEARVQGPVESATAASRDVVEPSFGEWPALPAEKDDPLPSAALRWTLPVLLVAAQVRILRDHVAKLHDLEDAARRCGIDPWVGRPVGDLATMVVIISEIRDRLCVLESRRP